MLSTETSLFSSQGVIQLGERAANGTVKTFFDVGNAPKISVSLKTDVEEIKESTSGQRLPMARLEKGKSAEISMELHNFDKRTIEVLLRGLQTAVAASTVTAEAMQIGMAVGDIYRTAKPFISTVVVKDSAGTPATLAAGTDYTLDADAGLVRLLNVTGFTQPFKVDYAYAGADVNAMFVTSQKEYTVFFSGVNTANADKPVLVELYRAIFDPADNIDFISDTVNVFTLKGSLLIDSTKSASDPALGQFGRVMTKTPV
ncbi:MAG: hypothetical protein ABIG70_02970 [Pseudomonadota bacterium]